jgi:hypothetical protein
MGSDEEQLASNVKITSNIVPFLLSVILIGIRGVIAKRFSGGFGTGNSSLWGVDVIAVFGFGGDPYYVC